MCYRGDTELGGAFSLQELPGWASLWGCVLPPVRPRRTPCVSGGSPWFSCPHHPPLTIAVLATLVVCLCQSRRPLSLFRFLSPILLCPLVSWSPSLPLSSPVWALCFSVAPCLSSSLTASAPLHVEVRPEWHWVPPDAWPSLRWASRADLKFLEAVRPRLLVVVLLGHLTDAPPRKTVAQ